MKSGFILIILSAKCNLCMLVFPGSTQLGIHLIEHTFMGCSNYTCYICSSVFTTAAGLQSHISDHGLSARPYDCSKCSKKFFFRAELENHCLGHTHKSPQLTCESNRQDNRLIEFLQNKQASSEGNVNNISYDSITKEDNTQNENKADIIGQISAEDLRQEVTKLKLEVEPTESPRISLSANDEINDSLSVIKTEEH